MAANRLGVQVRNGMGNHKGHFACQVGLQCLGNPVVCTDRDFSSCEYLSEQEGGRYWHRCNWSRNGGQGGARDSRTGEEDFGCGERNGSWIEKQRSTMRNIQRMLYKQVGRFIDPCLLWLAW